MENYKSSVRNRWHWTCFSLVATTISAIEFWHVTSENRTHIELMEPLMEPWIPPLCIHVEMYFRYLFVCFFLYLVGKREKFVDFTPKWVRIDIHICFRVLQRIVMRFPAVVRINEHNVLHYRGKDEYNLAGCVRSIIGSTRHLFSHPLHHEVIGPRNGLQLFPFLRESLPRFVTIFFLSFLLFVHDGNSTPKQASSSSHAQFMTEFGFFIFSLFRR